MLPPALIVPQKINKLLKKTSITFFLANFTVNAAFTATLFIEIASKAKHENIRVGKLSFKNSSFIKSSSKPVRFFVKFLIF